MGSEVKEQVWRLEFNEEDLRWLDQGIQHIPHFAAVKLLSKINAQIQEQQTPPDPPQTKVTPWPKEQ